MSTTKLSWTKPSVSSSTETGNWADLITLDLSKFDQPGGKQELAAEFTKAIEEVGFFYVKNFGLTDQDVETQFAIGQALLALPADEKMRYLANMQAGEYHGYKPAGTRELAPGVRDNYELYNVPKFTAAHAGMAHPEVVREHWDAIARFARHVHGHIVHRLLVVFAIALGLEDEEWLVKRHRYEAESACHLRYMKYLVRSEEENEKCGGVWLKGHSDLGSLTLLFYQPIGGLQVLAKDGSWKDVRMVPGTLTVNLADALHFLTSKSLSSPYPDDDNISLTFVPVLLIDGYLKSSIHRVIAPPPDQRHMDRLRVIYVVRIEDDTDMIPIQDSPVLRERGLLEQKVLGSDGKPIKAGEWVKQRVIKNIGPGTSTSAGDNADKEVEIVNGVKIKYFD